MASIRRVALSLLLAVVVAVLSMTAIQLWNNREPDGSLPRGPNHSDVDQRARILEDRVEVLTRRVADMQLLVVLLLGASGLYALVFAASSYFSGKSFARQADRTVAHMQDEIGAAMDDLRDLQEQTRRGMDAGLGRQMAGLYRNFAAMHAADDGARARFYLDRALVLASPDPELTAEIRYDLACWFAAARDYEQAMRELTAAFQHHSRGLDARLSTDLEEGGKLYDLAATPPFDRQLNDLLLNVSIP